MNGKGSYSVKTNNSGGTPGGTSRVHKIDSLTPYQNRYNLKKISKKQNMCMYCNYTTTVTCICRSPILTVLHNLIEIWLVNLPLCDTLYKYGMLLDLV